VDGNDECRASYKVKQLKNVSGGLLGCGTYKLISTKQKCPSGIQHEYEDVFRLAQP